MVTSCATACPLDGATGGIMFVALSVRQCVRPAGIFLPSTSGCSLSAADVPRLVGARCALGELTSRCE